MSVEIQTERLVLRPWRESEAEVMFRWASNPAIGPIAGWPVHRSVEESREIIRTVFSAPETYAIVLRSTGEPIGSVAIKSGEGVSPSLRESGGAELGYWLAEPYWGKGLMPEAVGAATEYLFDAVGLDFILVGHFEWNRQSARVIEKRGFEYVRTIPYKTRMGTVEQSREYILYNPACARQ